MKTLALIVTSLLMFAVLGAILAVLFAPIEFYAAELQEILEPYVGARLSILAAVVVPFGAIWALVVVAIWIAGRLRRRRAA